MEVTQGIKYNLRGVMMGIRTPRLMLLGMIRFLVLILITIGFIFIIFAYHEEILTTLWARPESSWLVWVWYLVSLLLSLLLSALSAVVSYIVSQLLFSVFIMDAMSRITERILTGKTQDAGMSLGMQFVFLIKQEIPRAILPVFITMMLMIFGWLTPLGPVIAVISSLAAAVFLAWDHTDLLPARQMQPFSVRFRFLMSTLPFHLGFGLLFLVPGLNIFLLSFAPVGGTIYHVERSVLPK